MNYTRFVLRVQEILGVNTLIERVNSYPVDLVNLHRYKNRAIKINGHSTNLVVSGDLVCVTNNDIIILFVDDYNIREYILPFKNRADGRGNEPDSESRTVVRRETGIE